MASKQTSADNERQHQIVAEARRYQAHGGSLTLTRPPLGVRVLVAKGL